MNDRILYLSCWLTVVATFSSSMQADPDLWGHLHYGLNHLKTGVLPKTDPFSYTALGYTWINHEWLSELLFAISWQAAGVTGLWALRMLLTAATLGAVIWFVRKTTSGIYSSILVLIVCLPEISIGFSFRPQLFSFLFFSIILLLIQQLRQRNSYIPITSLVFIPVMSLWANLHGGFLIGLCLLCWYWVCLVIEKLTVGLRTSFLVTISAAVITAAAATLVNPYGFELWRFLMRSLSEPRSGYITEWNSILQTDMNGVVISFWAIALCSTFIFFFTRKRRDLFEWGLLLALALASFYNIRHGVFLGISVLVIMPKHLESISPWLANSRNFHRAFVYAIFLVAMVFAVVVHLPKGQRPNEMIVQTEVQPYNAYKFIHDNDLKGNIAMLFDWAQSGIWYLNETCQVAFDGRFRTVYSKRIEDDYVQFHTMKKHWQNLIDNYDTHIILMPEVWLGNELLQQRGDWVLAAQSRHVLDTSSLDTDTENFVLLLKRGKFEKFEKRLRDGEIYPLSEKKYFYLGESL